MIPDYAAVDARQLSVPQLVQFSQPDIVYGHLVFEARIGLEIRSWLTPRRSRKDIGDSTRF